MSTFNNTLKPNPMIILSMSDSFLNNKCVNEYPEKKSKRKGSNSLERIDLEFKKLGT